MPSMRYLAKLGEIQKLPPDERAAAKAALDAEYGVRGKPLSEVGTHTETGQLACPKCRGTQFTAKRSLAGKLAGGLLAPKSQVRCVTCGTTYRRG